VGGSLPPADFSLIEMLESGVVTFAGMTRLLSF